MEEEGRRKVVEEEDPISLRLSLLLREPLFRLETREEMWTLIYEREEGVTDRAER